MYLIKIPMFANVFISCVSMKLTLVLNEFTVFLGQSQVVPRNDGFLGLL